MKERTTPALAICALGLALVAGARVPAAPVEFDAVIDFDAATGMILDQYYVRDDGSALRES